MKVSIELDSFALRILAAVFFVGWGAMEAGSDVVSALAAVFMALKP